MWHRLRFPIQPGRTDPGPVHQRQRQPAMFMNVNGVQSRAFTLAQQGEVRRALYHVLWACALLEGAKHQVELGRDLLNEDLKPWVLARRFMIERMDWQRRDRLLIHPVQLTSSPRRLTQKRGQQPHASTPHERRAIINRHNRCAELVPKRRSPQQLLILWRSDPRHA